MKKLSEYKEVPKVGQIYEHYKGKEAYYEIIEIAQEVDTNRFLVIYKKTWDDCIWARELEEFTGNVVKNGKEVKRFTLTGV